MAILLVFWGTPILFSIMAVPVCIPTNSAGGYLFLYIFPAFLICKVFNDGHLTGMRWYFIVLLICKDRVVSCLSLRKKKNRGAFCLSFKVAQHCDRWYRDTMDPPLPLWLQINCWPVLPLLSPSLPVWRLTLPFQWYMDQELTIVGHVSKVLEIDLELRQV